MMKKCEVTINNSAVTVADYDGDLIQFPSIGKDEKYLYVENVGEKYSIVENNSTTKKATKTVKSDDNN